MKKLNFLKLTLLAIVMMVGSVGLNAQTETEIYSTGFEAPDFKASTTYNNTTVAYTGPTGQQWGTYYGTPSTTAPITPSQSMQMRWYTSGPNGYTFTNFDLPKVTKVTFKAKNTNGINVIASYSTDGGASWVGDETFTLSTTAADFTYDISATGEYDNVRIKFSLTYATQPTATSRLYIDDVKVYGMTGGAPTPSIAVNPTSLDFGNVASGTSSTAQNITVTSANLTDVPVVSITGTDAAMFTQTGTLTVDGGTLSVTFSPTSVGVKSATLTLTSGAASASVALSGVAPDPNNPYNLDDSSPVNNLNETFEGGSIPTTWTNVAVQGDKVWEYKTYGGNSYAQMSAYGGTGVYQTLLISPAIDFDAITKNNVKFDWNSGYANGAELKVYVMSKDGTKTAVKSIIDNVNTSGYGASFTTETLDLSAYSGVKFLVFEYNGDAGNGQTTTYQVDNVVVLDNTPTILVDKTNLSFSADVNATSAGQVVNVTGSNLTVIPTYEITGTNAAEFNANGTLTITGGEITVTFAPTSVGDKSATLTITSGTASKSVNLTGQATEPIITTGDGSEGNPYTVADVKLLNNSTGSTKYWVKGYVIGVPIGGNGTDLTTVETAPPFTKNTAIALSDSPFETDLTEMLAIQLPSGAVRTALNLVDNSELLNVPILVYGTLDAYFANIGVKNTTDYRVLKSVFKTAGNWSVGTNWYAGVAPASTDDVIIKAAATLDGNVDVKNLTIASGATLLTGTHTLNVTSGSVLVEQAAKKYQTYYIGCPVGGTVLTDNIGDAITFDEASNTWSAPAAFPGTPEFGKGYSVQVGALVPEAEKGQPVTLSFLGETLNNGTKNVTLTVGDRKFNFLGNPYPSYLDGLKVVANANLEKTIWMYFKDGTYAFKFYNPEAGTGTLNDKYIPSMQGFWVRALPAITSSFTFTFDNDMRAHKGTSTTAFCAPQASERQELRLALSDGTVSDVAILLFSENANSNWNSSKMMNPGLNIYTVKGGADLSLNSRTAIEYDVETPVGVKVESGAYTFSASEYNNFGAEKAFLLDKVANVATDLSSGDYTVNFTEAYEGTDRFALVFPRSGVISNLENAEAAGFFAFASNNRISVNSDAQAGMIYVFNGLGQQVAAQSVSGNLTTVSTTLPAGVYLVKLNNLTTKVVVK